MFQPSKNWRCVEICTPCMSYVRRPTHRRPELCTLAGDRPPTIKTAQKSTIRRRCHHHRLLLMTPLVPRSTRARPVLELQHDGVAVYLNNINSPGLFHSSDFTIQSPSFAAHAISCKVAHCSSMILIQDLSLTFKEVCVQFWSMENPSSKPVFSFSIHVPMEWDMIRLLQRIEASIQSNKCISLINSYTLNGKILSWNTINTIHHDFI